MGHCQAQRARGPYLQPSGQRAHGALSSPAGKKTIPAAQWAKTPWGSVKPSGQENHTCSPVGKEPMGHCQAQRARKPYLQPGGQRAHGALLSPAGKKTIPAARWAKSPWGIAKPSGQENHTCSPVGKEPKRLENHTCSPMGKEPMGHCQAQRARKPYLQPSEQRAHGALSGPKG